jgi:hypothetical protein
MVVIRTDAACAHHDASWKFPRAGFILFAILFGIQLIECILPHLTFSECSRGLALFVAIAPPLLLNLILVDTRECEHWKIKT